MPSYADLVVADGAVAYWRLGERSGTTVKSLVAGVPDGTIAGALTLGVAGALSDGDTAMSFDGVDDKATIPNAAYLAFGTGALAAELWLRMDSVPGGTLRVVKTGRTIGVEITVDASNLTFFLNDGTGFPAVSTLRPTLNQWHHVVATVTRGPDRQQLYLNGTLAADSLLPRQGVDLTQISDATQIGAHPDNVGWWKGQIDEVAIYKVALTPAQIAAHYAARATTYPGYVLADGAVAYWRLNEASGTTVRSLVAGVPDGAISGGVTLGQAGALSDGDTAMRFDGVDDRIQIPNGPFAAIGTGPVTLEAWVRTRGSIAGKRPTAISTGNPEAQQSSVALYLDAPPLVYFRVHDGTTGIALASDSPTTSVIDGGWHHLVAVLRRGTPSDTLEIWIDSVLVKTGTTTAGRNYSAAAADSWIGGVATVPHLTMDWEVDEVAVYKTALSPTQIQQHYAARTYVPTYAERVLADGAVAHWKLDEKSGTVAVDAIGGNNGTLAGGVIPGVAGRVSTAMQFDGVDDRIEIPIGNWNAFGTGPVTIEAWVRMVGSIAGKQPAIFSTENPQTALAGVSLFFDATPSLYFRIRDGVGAAAQSTSATMFLDGSWHQVVGVLARGTPNDTLTLYIDGVHRVTAPTPAKGSVTSTAPNSWIGGVATIASMTMKWEVDEVAVYKAALTSEQVAAHHATGTTLAPRGAGSRRSQRTRMLNPTPLPPNSAPPNGQMTARLFKTHRPGTIWAPGSRAAGTIVSQEYDSLGAEGLQLVVDIDATSGGTVVVSVLGRNPATGEFIPVPGAATAVLASVGQTILDVHDLALLPHVFKVQAVVASGAVTFSVGGTLLL